VRTRPLALAVLAFALGCAGGGSKVVEDAGEFRGHRRIGVAPFVDSRGQGEAVADAIAAGLREMRYEPVDQKALAQVLRSRMPNASFILGIEALERIQEKVPVDAIIFGRIAPDWSSALMTVNETEMGDPILQIVLKPRDRKRAAFADAGELAKEALRVLASLR
jgi:hypothetical protein